MNIPIQKKIEIEVVERLSDFWFDSSGKKQPKYHASIKGDSRMFGVGRSVDAAIGDLIQAHQDEFSVRINFIGFEK